MLPEAQQEALRCLREARWRLLESFALARQEGLVDPVGLVIEPGFPYGRGLAQRLLLIADSGARQRPTVTCMERAALASVLTAPAPDIAAALRGFQDEPGRWSAVILARTGSVLTGSWQELFTLETEHSGRATSRS
jgi:hypothetical protein